MRVISIFMTGLMMLLITACSIQSNNIPSDNQKQEATNTPETEETVAFDPPNVAEVSFQPLELNELLEGKQRENWDYIKSIPLTVVNEKDVTLHVYKDIDANGLCKDSTVTLLEYDGKTYELNECTSERLLQENLEEIGALYIIDHLFEDQERQQIVLSSIELLANGPGRMMYVVYDILEEKFLTFEDWGTPFISDLKEEEPFLVIQFPGLHMHSPDVNLYRWINGQFEKSQSLKEALGLSNQQGYIEFNEITKFFIAYSPLDTDDQEFLEVQYKYESGKLVKQ
jgi:hypothetical protein